MPKNEGKMGNSTIISVSIPRDMAEFLDNTELSASKLLQEMILEQMRIWNQHQGQQQKLLKNIESLQKELGFYSQYLEEKGLYEEFHKWRFVDVRVPEKA